MTPDELRGLADSLMHYRQCDEDGTECATSREAVHVAAAYLRQQADAVEPAIAAEREQSIPQPARKVGGTYQADGVVLVRFTTRAGAKRVVFEFDSPAGMLHIFNEDQIEVAG